MWDCKVWIIQTENQCINASIHAWHIKIFIEKINKYWENWVLQARESPLALQKWLKTADLLFGGHGLGVQSVLGLALISAIRSLNLAPSDITVLYAWREKTTICNTSPTTCFPKINVFYISDVNLILWQDEQVSKLKWFTYIWNGTNKSSTAQ